MRFSKFDWHNYKQTERGQKSIKDFTFCDDGRPMIEISFEYNQELKRRFNNQKSLSSIDYVLDYLIPYIDDYSKPKSINEAEILFSYLVTVPFFEDEKGKNDYLFRSDIITWISWLLYEKGDDFFIPYLFQYNVLPLYQLSDTFNITLPKLPPKSDHKQRCMFYWQICKELYKFRISNELTPPELCAFLYDYAPEHTKVEIDSVLPKPSQAWLIGGVIRPTSLTEKPFWQSNAETKRGDILIHYETSPVSAITNIWLSDTDGVIDPFFHYYSNVYLRDRIQIPHITLKELKDDYYFSKNPLVKRNFQGVNGCLISSNDYKELLRILSSKGFDVSLLPVIYAPKQSKNENVFLEKDVEEKLLNPLLKEMGWEYGCDFERQVPIKAGRGKVIFPDYALHVQSINDEIIAKVIIEAKYNIKNNQEFVEAFTQARSYAHLLSAKIIILCDKNALFVFEQKSGFNRNDYLKVYWDDLSNPDTYNKLKKLLRK